MESQTENREDAAQTLATIILGSFEQAKLKPGTISKRELSAAVKITRRALHARDWFRKRQREAIGRALPEGIKIGDALKVRTKKGEIISGRFVTWNQNSRRAKILDDATGRILVGACLPSEEGEQ